MNSKLNSHLMFASALFAALVLCACSAIPESPELKNAGRSSKFLVVADPQLHNAHGLSLKQMMPLADWISGVAIRPPELNLLAPLLLERLIDTGRQNAPNVMLVLGDVGNIGCIGEIEYFYKIVNARAGPLLPVIMAHGNHDTYLMGTVNHDFPIDDAKDWQPRLMQKSNLPTDES